MPESPKRSILVKGNCTYCDKPVGVEVEEPAPVIQVKTEPCKCGLTEDARQSRHWATTFGFVGVAGLLTLLGTCYSKDRYEPDKIRAETEKMKVELVKEQERNAELSTQLSKYKSIIEDLRKATLPREEK